jgi:hypothetical protein
MFELLAHPLDLAARRRLSQTRALNEAVVAAAVGMGIEDGAQLRVDFYNGQVPRHQAFHRAFGRLTPDSSA